MLYEDRLVSPEKEALLNACSGPVSQEIATRIAEFRTPHHTRTNEHGWEFYNREDANAFLTRQICRHVALSLRGGRDDKDYILRLIAAVEQA